MRECLPTITCITSKITPKYFPSVQTVWMKSSLCVCMPGVDIIAGLVTSHLPLMKALHYTSKRVMISHKPPAQHAYCLMNSHDTKRPLHPLKPLLSALHTPASTSSLDGPKLAHVHLHHASSTCQTHHTWVLARPFGRSALGGVSVSRADAGAHDPESDFRTARRHASTDVSAVECPLDNTDAVEGFQFEFRKTKTKGSIKACQRCNVVWYLLYDKSGFRLGTF